MSQIPKSIYKKLLGGIGSLSILVMLGLGGCGGGGGGVGGVGGVGGGASSLPTSPSPSVPTSLTCTTSINTGFTGGDLNQTYSPALTGGGGGGDGGSGGSGGSGGGAGAGGGEGKVLGGLMTITRLSDGKILGSAITDSTTGLVTIAPCGSDLPVLLTLSGQNGAQYYDEGTNKITPFPVGTTLHALVDQFDENVGVSFLTEGAYQYAVNNLGAANGSLVGLSLAKVQLANQTVLNAINANLPKAVQLVTLKSLPTPIDSKSDANSLLANRYGIAETVIGGMVSAAATAQPASTAPALGLGIQLDADLTDGKIDNLVITGAAAATGSNVYYTPATLPAATLAGMGAVAKQFGASTILPLLQTSVTVLLSSPTIDIGQSSTLTWSTNNATSCTATGSWSGTEPIAGTSILTPAAAGTSTYILTCTGPGGSASSQATLTVDASTSGPVSPSTPVPVVSISSSPASITQGQSSTLTWSVSNATSCTATGGWSGSQALTGNSSVTPSAAGSVTYELSCTGAGGSGSGKTTLTVTAATSTTVVSTLAGTAGAIGGSADGTGAAASFGTLGEAVIDSAGNVYVADYNNNNIRKITPAGVVSTLAGTAGVTGSADGTGAAASFNQPHGVATDSAGNVYVADSSNSTIRKITPSGVVSTLAGSAGVTGSADGTGAAASFNQPFGVTTDSAGNVYVADTLNSTIRKITPGGVVSTLAGSAGVTGSADGAGAAANFKSPQGVATDSAGNVYVADWGNDTIRKITPGGVVTTLAGTATLNGSADGTGPAARFSTPQGIATDSAGNVYVADSGNDTIRKITPAGVVTTLAGSAGVKGSANGSTAVALFSDPQGIAVDSAGNIYVADAGNSTIRKITLP